MISGDLRERVEILAPLEVQTASGYVEQTTAHLCFMSAKITSVSGKDFYAALAAGAQDVLTITVRWNPAITTAHAVSWNQTVYEILEINYLGVKRDFMTLKCRARKGAAAH